MVVEGVALPRVALRREINGLGSPPESGSLGAASFWRQEANIFVVGPFHVNL